MKILLVYPAFDKFLANQDAVLQEFLAGRELDFSNVARFVAPPALGLPILGALTPARHELQLVDDQLERPEAVTDADLVAVSFFTPQAQRAREICEHFRAAGTPVVAGGMHPSALPEEAQTFADAVCVGEGEQVWPTILADAERGALAPLYRGAPAPLDRGPVPRRDLHYDKEGYTWETDVLQVARGCDVPCDPCVIPGIFGRDVRFRAVDAVLEDVASISYRRVYLADDQPFHKNPQAEAYADALFGALRGCGKEIFVNSALSLNSAPGLLRKMRAAGVTVFYCTLGIDPISRGALRGNPATVERVADQIKRVQDEGMIFFASFVVGSDEHGPEVKDQILELCRRCEIHLAEFFISIPIPGTPLWRKLQTQGRILHREWAKYNGSHVVFRPARLSAEALQRLYLELWAEFSTGTDRLVSSTERARFEQLEAEPSTDGAPPEE